MFFRQLFDYETWSFSYLIACEKTRQALIIDSVLSQVELIKQYLEEFDLKLVKSLETHVHADHITGAGKLREIFGCETFSAVESKVACASNTFKNDDIITVGDLSLKAIATPGHTDDSYSFLLVENQQFYLFTGDTLFARGTGRTDFQNGNAENLFDSLQKLFAFPDTTLVYPAHDYKGRNVSTIGEEKRFNPRVVGKDKAAFVAQMKKLVLPNPKFIDIAVPANKACGQIKMEA